jgi:hypothetical protein
MMFWPRGGGSCIWANIPGNNLNTKVGFRQGIWDVDMGQYLKYAFSHDTCYVVGTLIIPISAIICQVSNLVRVVIFF